MYFLWHRLLSEISEVSPVYLIKHEDSLFANTLINNEDISCMSDAIGTEVAEETLLKIKNILLTITSKHRAKEK